MKKYPLAVVWACLAVLYLAGFSCSLPSPLGSVDSDAALAARGISSKGAKTVAVHDPGQAGPYTVGHTAFMLYDPSRPCDLGDRPIPVDVFYPVDPSAVGASTPEAVYLMDPINGVWPPTESSDWEAYGMDRAYQNPPASAQKPFPLVMFSPGWGAPTWIHNLFAARAATHGFVVAVMYHYGDWAFVGEQFDHIAVASLNRPQDVSFVLDHLLVRNAAAGDLLCGTFDPARIGASGWSLGGFACAVLAGGVSSVGDVFNYPGWQEWAGGPPPPQTLVPLYPDPRIEAILPLDGANWLIPFHELARVTVPAMGIGQEWDALALSMGPDWVSWQARQHAAFQGHPNYRVDVGDTNHQSFSNMYEGLTLAFHKGFMSQEEYDWLYDTYFSVPLASGEANRLTAKYAIAFLKTVLAGETGYQSILTPGYALRREQYIEFFVTEKRSPSSIEEDWPNWPVESTYFAHQPGSDDAKADKKAATALRLARKPE